MDVHDRFDGALAERNGLIAALREADVDRFCNSLGWLISAVQDDWLKKRCLRAVLGVEEEASVAEVVKWAAICSTEEGVEPQTFSYRDRADVVGVVYNVPEDNGGGV